MKIGPVLICAFALAMAPFAGAQSVSAWDLVYPSNFNWEIRTHRVRVANDLASRVSLLVAVVPRQTEEESARLRETEQTLEARGADASPRDRSRLYLSRAYQHRRLLELLADTLDALQCVRSAEELPREVHCWTRAAVNLMDEETVDVALTVLRDARMVPRDEDMPVKAQDPKVWYGEYGKGIVRHIVMPYLAGLAAPRTPAATEEEVSHDG
ncbi:MAG TPA: hypothetical protein VIS55_10595 [Pseudomonadales bacterium]|jgi:hypothetical protein